MPPVKAACLSVLLPTQFPAATCGGGVVNEVLAEWAFDLAATWQPSRETMKELAVEVACDLVGA